MGTEEEVKLYGGLRSPYSRRVEIALKLKGIPYDFILEDIRNKSQYLLKYNPVHKKIPALVHNGKPVVESRVILEYIDETWPDSYPILPRDPYDRAMARFWAMFIDDKCVPSIWKAFFEVDPKEQKKASEEASENIRLLENELAEGNKKFFGGERVGYVDIVASWIACWIGPIQEISGKKDFFTNEKYPCLSIWIDDFLSCDIITNLPQRHSLVDFLKAYIEAAKISK